MTTQDQKIQELISALQENMLHRDACEHAKLLTKRIVHKWASYITIIFYFVVVTMVIYNYKVRILPTLIILIFVSFMFYMIVDMCIYTFFGIYNRSYKKYIHSIKSNSIELQKFTIQALQDNIKNTEIQIEGYQKNILALQESIKNEYQRIDEYTKMLQYV